MFRAFAFGIPVGDGCAREARGRWGWGGFEEFWAPRGRHHRGRMGRVFEQGASLVERGSPGSADVHAELRVLRQGRACTLSAGRQEAGLLRRTYVAHQIPG